MDSEIEIKRRKNRIKSIIFWAIMLVYVVLWLWGIWVLCNKVWAFCTNYQEQYETALAAANPDLVMDEAISAFYPGNILELLENQFDDVSSLEYSDASTKLVNSLVENKNITYKRALGFSDRRPVYDVYADESLIGEVRMKQLAQGDNFGFHMSEVIDVKLLWEAPQLISVDFEAPYLAVVTVNGQELDSSYIVDTKMISSQMGDKATELTGTEFGTYYYHIEGFLNEPEIEFEEYKAYIPDEKMSDLFLAANEAYIKNMNSYLGISGIKNYFETDGPAYANIQSAQAGLAWSGKPDKLEITDAGILNVTKYSDEVLVVNTVSKVYRLYRAKEYNEDMNYEWLYIKHGDSWKIRDYRMIH